MEPRQLASLVRNAIASVMDVKLFKANVAKMEKGRKELLKFAETWESK